MKVSALPVNGREGGFDKENQGRRDGRSMIGDSCSLRSDTGVDGLESCRFLDNQLHLCLFTSYPRVSEWGLIN